MRIVLDTNILISSMLSPASPPGQILEAWHAGRFRVLSSDDQIAEFIRVVQYPKIRRRLKPETLEDIWKHIHAEAEILTNLPRFNLCNDPDDDRILSIAVCGRADYLITGDKTHLLNLKKAGETNILTARGFIEKIYCDT